MICFDLSRTWSDVLKMQVTQLASPLQSGRACSYRVEGLTQLPDMATHHSHLWGLTGEREVGALASRLLQCKLTTNRFKKNCYGARNSRYTDSRQQSSALTCARSHWLEIPDSLGVMSACFRDLAAVRAKGHGSERPAGRPASAG